MYKIKLHPIVFFILTISFKSTCQTDTYEYKNVGDPVMLSSGVVFMITSLHLRQHIQPIDTLLLDKDRIFVLDRWACRPKNPVIKNLSHLTLIASILLPYWVSYQHQQKNDDKHIQYLMTFETQLLTGSICSVVKELTRRPRPYVYYTSNANLSMLSPEASRSFYSQHASIAFCSAMITAHMMHYESSSLDQKEVLVLGFSLATCTSVFRVLAGEHFPTDVMAGMLFGSLIGFFLPEIHR